MTTRSSTHHREPARGSSTPPRPPPASSRSGVRRVPPVAAPWRSTWRPSWLAGPHAACGRRHLRGVGGPVVGSARRGSRHGGSRSGRRPGRARRGLARPARPGGRGPAARAHRHPRAERWTELRAASVAHVLSVARQLAQFVVVDCGFCLEDDEELSYDTLAPRRNAATLTALEAADGLLVSALPIRSACSGWCAGCRTSPRSRLPRPTSWSTRCGLRRWVRTQRRIAEALGRFAGMDDLSFRAVDPGTFDGAMLAGRTLAEFAPQSPVRRAIADLSGRYAGTSPEAPSRRSRRRRRR